jgi:hypothetical protein
MQNGRGGAQAQHSECPVLGLFRQIWPEKEEGSVWCDDWESWPLEELEDE